MSGAVVHLHPPYTCWCLGNAMYLYCGLGSVVGIGGWLRARRSGDRICVGRARFSAPIQTGPGAHPATCTMGTGSFPGVKSARGMTLTLHPLLVPWSWKSSAIPLLPLWAVRPVQSLSACTRVNFTLCTCIRGNHFDSQPEISCGLSPASNDGGPGSIPRGIYDGQSGTGPGFSPSTSIYPSSIFPPMLRTHSSI